MRVRNDNLNIPAVLGYRVKTSLYQPKCDRQKRLETSELLIRPLEDLNSRQGIAVFGRSPPLWAMGVAHALQTIANRVGSHK